MSHNPSDVAHGASHTFLFVSAPLPGHMDWGGMHHTARVLHTRGHRVLWATEPSGFPHLERLGIPTVPLSPTGWWTSPPPLPRGLSGEALARERQRRAVAAWLAPERVIPATEALLSLVREIQPDLLVTEPFMAAAGLAAELADVPLVVVGWPATAMPERPRDHQREAARLAATWFEQLKAHFRVQGRFWAPGGLPWLRSRHAHVVYFTPEWYATWRVLAPPTMFVGGRPTPPNEPPPLWWNMLSEEEPLVLITLGSVFVEDEMFFRAAIEAVHEVGARAIVATGKPSLAERLRVEAPREAIIVPWVPYAHLFPRLRLVIHHGGVGTTHAALVYGVPQIVVPHAADQYQQAARVQRTGVGVALHVRDVTVQRLVRLARALLQEGAWRERAQAMAERMAALGGAERAATILRSLT